MFDFDLSKLLLIGVVALIFIPPKDLPQALRQLGRLLGQARRMATDFRAQFDEALRESELHELKDEFAHLKQKASLEGTMNRIADMIEPAKPSEPVAAAKPAEPVEAGPPAEPVEAGPVETVEASAPVAELAKPIEMTELPPPPAARESQS
jgi:sec-independent protein translocase protein TatB